MHPKDCSFSTNDRTIFWHHVYAGVSDTTHSDALKHICGEEHEYFDWSDYVDGACANAERERWPLLGLSTTRRALNLFCDRYNDDKIKCMPCFICGQLRTTCEGYTSVNLGVPAEESKEMPRNALEQLQL